MFSNMEMFDNAGNVHLDWGSVVWGFFSRYLRLFFLGNGGCWKCLNRYDKDEAIDVHALWHAS